MNKNKRPYLYASLPILTGILLCMYSMVQSFSNMAELTGGEKAAALAEVISKSLWFVCGGITISTVWVLILKIVKFKKA